MSRLLVEDIILESDGYGAVDVYGPTGDHVGTITASGLLDAAKIHDDELSRLASKEDNNDG